MRVLKGIPIKAQVIAGAAVMALSAGATVAVVMLAGTSATLSGTVISSPPTEADIRDGGKTIVITLPGENTEDPKWRAEDDGNGNRRLTPAATGLFAKITGSASDAEDGWNDEVNLSASSTEVTNSDKTLTITLPAAADYNVFGDETITIANIPSDAVTGDSPMSVSPGSFDVSSLVNPADVDDGLAAFSAYLQAAVEASATTATHTVESGDTCLSITSERNVSLGQLLEANSLSTDLSFEQCDTQLISVGTDLDVPLVLPAIGELSDTAVGDLKATVQPFDTAVSGASESQIQSDLEAIDGVTNVSVVKEKYTITFSKTVDVENIVPDYTLRTAADGEVVSFAEDPTTATVPLTVDMTFSFEAGTSTFSILTDGGDAEDIKVRIGSATGTDTGKRDGRLGFVDVVADTTLSSSGAAISIDLTDVGGDGALTTAELEADKTGLARVSSSLEGTLDVRLSDITLTGGLLSGITAATTFRWPDLAKPSSVEPLNPGETATTTLADSGLGTAGFDRFLNADAQSFGSGFNFVALWFGQLTDVGPLGEKLPLIRPSLGQALNPAQTLATESRAFSLELAKDPDVSFQGIDDVMNTAVSGISPAGAVPDDGLRVVTATESAEKPVALEMDVRLERKVFVEPHVVKSGETCSGIAAAEGLTTNELLVLNGFSTAAECDAAVAPGNSLVIGQIPPAFDLDLGFGDVLEIDIPGSIVKIDGVTATLTARMTLGVKIKHDADLTGELGIDEADLVDGHRLYVKPASDLVSLSPRIEKSGMSASVRYGVLEMDVTGDVAITPAVSLGFSDPGTVAGDGLADLVELDKATSDLAAILDADLSGGVTADIEVASNILVDSPGGSPRHIDVVGNLRALDNANGVFKLVPNRINEGSLGEDSPLAADGATVDPNGPVDKVYIGHDLAELLFFNTFTIDDLLDRLEDTGDWLGEAGDNSVLSEPIPIVDARILDVVDAAGAAAGIADSARQEAGETLTSFRDALCGALTDAGIVTTGGTCDLTLRITPDALLLVFRLADDATETLPISLPTQDFDIVSADADASATVTAGFEFPLTLGLLLDTSATGSERAFIESTSGLSFTADIDSTIDASVAFGAFTGTLTGPVKLTDGKITVGLVDPNSDGRITLAELQADQETSLSVTPSGEITADLDAQIKDLPPADVVVRGNLSALDNGSGNIFELSTDVPGVKDAKPADLDVVKVAANFEGMDELKLDIRTMISGTIIATKFVGRTVKKSDALNLDLPVIGNVNGDVNTVGATMEEIGFEMERIWNDVRNDGGGFVKVVEKELEVFINKELLGISSFPAVDSYDGDCAGLGQSTCIVNVKLTAELTDGTSVEVNDGAVSPSDFNTDLLLDAEQIVVEFEMLQSRDFTIPSLDSGLDLSPAFNLEFDTGETEATAGFRFRVGFGLNRENGFFLLTRGPNAPDDFHTLTLFLRLDNDELEADSKLFDLLDYRVGKDDVDFDGTDDPGKLAFRGACGPGDLNGACFFVDFKDTTGDGKTTQRTMGNRSKKADDVIEVSYDAILDVELPVKGVIEAKFDGDTVTFPSLLGKVIYLQRLTDGNFEDRTLVLSDMVMDAEDLGDILLPFLETMNDFSPVGKDPIKKILTTKAPVLDKTIVELADEVAEARNDKDLKRAVLLTKVLLALPGMVDQFKEAGAVRVQLGSMYVLPEPKKFMPPDFLLEEAGKPTDDVAEVRKLIDEGDMSVEDAVAKVFLDLALDDTSKPADISDQTAGTDGNADSLNAAANEKGTGTGDVVSPFRFPILEDASEAFNLLTGRPASVIEFVPGPYNLGPSIDFRQSVIEVNAKPFASGSVEAFVEGFYGVQVDFGIGFDTRGFTRGHEFMDGIYLIDNGGDTQANEVTLGARISAGARGDISILGGAASVKSGGSGGIELTGGLDLFDESPVLPPEDRGDGRFHLDELFTVVESSKAGGLAGDIGLPPEACIFAFNARFAGNVQAFAEIKALGKTVFEKEFEEEFTIFDERLECEPILPLSTVEVSSPAVLVLSMGPNADKRPDGRGDVNEKLEVSFDSSTNEYVIEAFGQTERVDACGHSGECISLIYADGGLDNDEVIIDSSVPVPVVLIGGPGDDRLIGSGQNDILIGDGGEVVGTPGDDFLDGLDGDDIIVGMEGDDEIFGRDGDDEIFADAADRNIGTQDIKDQTGDSTHTKDIPGDESSLDLSVGAGNDTVEAGDGADTVVGGDGDDDIIGEDGDDDISGEGGDDFISGNAGDDTISGGTGADDITGDDGGDTITGGDGNDFIDGGSGDDTINGNGGNDQITGDDGVDTIHGDAGNDHISGGRGADFLFGDAGEDVINGNDGNDTIRGGDGDDALFGDAGDDLMHGDAGDDFMLGGRANDEMHGGTGDDGMFGEEGEDLLFGDAGQDDLIGGSKDAGIEDGDDELHGGDGVDFMAGDNATILQPGTSTGGVKDRDVDLHDMATTDTSVFGDDLMFGEGGDDRMWGQRGHDDMIGGSGTAGAGDGGDTMQGSADHDVMVGDNATITRPGGTDDFSTSVKDVPRRTVVLLDVPTTSSSVSTSLFGDDLMTGNAGHDVMYGGGGNDLMSGDNVRSATGTITTTETSPADDIIYGNAGDDTIYGDGGQDDLVGGTGRTTSTDASTAVDDRLDGADTLYGGNGLGGVTSGDFDVIAGDNADLQRVLTGSGAWDTYSFLSASIVRTVKLLDVATVSSPAGAGTSGADTAYGEAQTDVIYGQGGNDTLRGYHVVGTAGAANDDDDFIFGNDGADTIYGDRGQDDLVGGTGRTTTDNDWSTTSDDSTAVDGRLDGDDTIYGGDGVSGITSGDFDVIAGDNALIDRPLDASGTWITISFDQWNRESASVGVMTQRIVKELDAPTLASPPGAGTSGSDTIYGEHQDDIIHGQTGDDTIYGDTGVAATDLSVPASDRGNDVIYAGAGDDDVGGGAGNDVVYGQGGIDHITGGGGTDVVEGGASNAGTASQVPDASAGSCTFGSRAFPDVSSNSFTADEARGTRETKGREEGTKGRTALKRENPACLQLVAIAVSPTSASIAVGGTVSLTATGTFDDGSAADVTEEVAWESTAPTVASVAVAGGVAAVTGNGAGAASVVARYHRISSAGVSITVTP